MRPRRDLRVAGLVRSAFMDRATFLGEGGPARRKQLETVLSSGAYGVVQARTSRSPDLCCDYTN